MRLKVYSGLSKPKSGKASRKPRPFRPKLEELDERAVPATFYVATNGDDNSSTPNNVSTPYRNIYRAVNQAQAGDTIIVRGGTYNEGIYLENRSGLTFRNYNGETPKVVSGNGQDGFFLVSSHNITIQGFEVTTTGGDRGNGITLYGHVTRVDIIGNVVHSFGGGGIITFNPAIDGGRDGGVDSNGNPVASNTGADYIRVIGNTVYGNCNWHRGDTSGISFYGMTNTDGTGGYHNVIENNRIYDNFEKWTGTSDYGWNFHTDGNGIILDLGGPNAPGTVIRNNLSYNNGGRGINIFKTSNVLVVNNTCYNNNLDSLLVDPAELNAGIAGNVQFVNNIVYGSSTSVPGGRTSQTIGSGVSFSNNLYFNVQSGTAIGGTVGNPSFVNAGTSDWRNANFKLNSGSPAINAGNTSTYAATDFEGTTRPQGSAPDIGAYEMPAGTSPPPATTPTPHGGSAVTIASSGSTTIQAENYDNGGSGVAYSDTDTANQGGAYRSDQVDVRTGANATGTNGTGYQVGWTAAGEWLGYTINVAQAGTYNITIRLASGGSGGNLNLQFGPVGQVGGSGVTTTPAFSIGNTGGWDTFTDVTVNNVSLSAGQQWMRMVLTTGGYDIDRIVFTRVNGNGNGGSVGDFTTSAGIGNPTPAGSASVSNGTYTVNGGGADIWNGSDQFHYVYRTLAGDGSITARVTSQTNTDPWAKAGVMIRAGTGASSRHAMAVITPGNGTRLQYRTSDGGSSSDVSGGGTFQWLRLVRGGGNVTAFRSSDGSSWTQIGSAVNLGTGSFLVGLAVTSHNTGSLSAATFTNVTISEGSSNGLTVYGDSLAGGWADWSWGVTRDFSNASPVRNGSSSIAVTYGSNYSALSLRRETALNTNGYTAIKFWVHGGSGANKTLTVTTRTQDDGGESSSVNVTAVAGQWTEVTVNLGSLGNPAIIKRLNIGSATAQTNAIYFDDIRLV